MDVEYIVVQAGGKGTRLQYLTENKPKALVPVDNLPMLFHLFERFPDKKFIIIGDYLSDVLDAYLNTFAKVKYLTVKATGTGTCGGLKQAISKIPENKSFMLIWSDLVLTDKFHMPSEEGNYVGISETFPCRWSYKDELFKEEPSSEFGVAGLFFFTDKTELKNVPDSGELVRWMQSENKKYKAWGIGGTKEYGLLEEYKKTGVKGCRPFNTIYEKDGKLGKQGIDEQGLELAKKEVAWYKYVEKLGYTKTPHIYSLDPIVMDRINGKNIYEYVDMPLEKKKEVLKDVVDNLKQLHALESSSTDYFSIKEAYVNKTFNRLQKIINLVPFAMNETITVNGRVCRNIFYHRKEIEQMVNDMEVKDFKLIHGDCTFSNMMLENDEKPMLIDPRGYFGFTRMHGDEAYDWAKVYYSLKGNYDRFNRKEFRLHINENDVKLEIESSGWEETEDLFFELIPVDKRTIKILHALIWLSLTTYAWEDYDSICGAFYNGLYYLEEVL